MQSRFIWASFAIDSIYFLISKLSHRYFILILLWKKTCRVASLSLYMSSGNHGQICGINWNCHYSNYIPNKEIQNRNIPKYKPIQFRKFYSRCLLSQVGISKLFLLFFILFLLYCPEILIWWKYASFIYFIRSFSKRPYHDFFYSIFMGRWSPPYIQTWKIILSCWEIDAECW